jgi:hypothetical protein
MTATVHKLKAGPTQLRCEGCGTLADAACDCGVGYLPVKASVAAAKAIEKNPEASNRAIAEKIGVNKDTVRVARKQVAENSPPAKRIGKDGKTRKMPKPTEAKVGAVNEDRTRNLFENADDEMNGLSSILNGPRRVGMKRGSSSSITTQSGSGTHAVLDCP